MQDEKTHEVLPTQILTTGSFTPKKGATIYNIGCNQSLVGCSAISAQVKLAAQALGYKYVLCDAGTSPQQATGCFNNAVNAKADGIVTNAVGTNTAGNGYAAAAAAHIPIAAIFSGDAPGAPGVIEEVGNTGCSDQGKIVADSAIANTNGKANALFLTESSIGCDIQRSQGFQAEMANCTGCKSQNLQFDIASVQSNLPRQITASIDANPSLNYIVGVLGAATTIGATAVEQSGKTIAVAGLDGDPANIARVRSKQTIVATVVFGRGEAAWTGVDAIARQLAGQPVRASAPVQIFLVNSDSVGLLPSTDEFNGPADYQQQFKSLWGIS